MNPLLELHNVSYAYHSKSGETYALSDISFQVFPGEFIAVIGPSGCGKSTLLSLISGLLLPESGSILFNGSPECSSQMNDTGSHRTDSKKNAKSARPVQDKIGYMLQKDHLFEWRTIYRNITLGLELQPRRPNAKRSSMDGAICPQTTVRGRFQPRRPNSDSLCRVDKMLKDYGLYRFRNAHPSELSGGMRQRAALIRTLAPDPDLLLLDEPFSALDFQTRLSVCDDVAAILRREKKTALLVTHDLSEAVSMADRVIVLTKRPARIRSVLEISFAQTDLTPFGRRSAPEFQGYFNLLWKELNPDESYRREEFR